MSSLPERINLYISSETRTTPNPSDFYVIISNTLYIDSDETFYFNVIQFNAFNNFYQTMKGYNTDFKILIYNKDDELHDTIIGELPEGNPTIIDIINYISNLLSGVVTVTYDKIKNKIIFTTISSNANHNKIYLNIINCDKILGFSRELRNKPILLEHDIPKYSDNPCNIISITNIFLHCYGDFTFNDYNFSNHDSNEMKSNNIMFSIPINCPFNHVITYNNEDGGNSFYFRVDKKTSINNIRLVIKDQYNEIIPNFNDYNIILQITKRKQINIIHKFLEVICEYLSQLMLLFGFVYESKLT
jgi:hypothetical protein